MLVEAGEDDWDAEDVTVFEASAVAARDMFDGDTVGAIDGEGVAVMVMVVVGTAGVKSGSLISPAGVFVAADTATRVVVCCRLKMKARGCDARSTLARLGNSVETRRKGMTYALAAEKIVSKQKRRVLNSMSNRKRGTNEPMNQ